MAKPGILSSSVHDHILSDVSAFDISGLVFFDNGWKNLGNSFGSDFVIGIE